MSEELPAVRHARPPELRISDADRERAVALLRQHCTDGRLTLDEFADRVGAVYEARTTGDLEQVTVDLPDLHPASHDAPLAPDTRRRRAVRWTVSIFSGNQQRGRWRIEGATNAVAFMGGCYLDLREAEVVGNEAVINTFAFMGGVDIVVPEGIDVVLDAVAFMGGKSARVKDVPVIPGSPVVRIRGFAFMGGINVRSKGASAVTSRGSRRRSGGRLERHERELARSRRRERGLAQRAVRERVHGIDAVAADVADQWPAVRAQVAPEGTVTIMFSDIEGFTALCERVGDHRANELLRAHYRLVRDEVARHGGFEVKVHGDGFMIAFSSASRALRCAQAIQAAQRRWNDEHPEEPLRVRMGLHTGEAIRDADDFLGTTVNVASRIASAAQGGEILVSALLRELCVSTGEFEFGDGADIELKGISQPQRVYPVNHG